MKVFLRREQLLYSNLPKGVNPTTQADIVAMKGKILVIDDEELVIKTIERLLSKEGYDVISVRNGQEAIRKVGEMDFDLLITDIRMPGMNGIETIRQIRNQLKIKGKPQIPEICITGFANNELNRQARELGVVGYIYKPFDLGDFLFCVKKNLA